MGNPYHRPTKRSKTYVPAELWDNAIAFCRCYPLWKAELLDCDMRRTATDYTRPVIQSSGDPHPVETLAIKRSALQKKMDIVERAARGATNNEVMYRYLLDGVTQRISYDILQRQGIPCGRRQYHQCRREMIYRVSMEL